MEFDFIKEFYKKIGERNISWEISALVTPEGNVYTLGSDSKLIGRIFELISYEIIKEIADENELLLLPSDRQTVYPDFTLMKDERDERKIAIDIKSTYRLSGEDRKSKLFNFTLGSYASFMRNGTKNIMFPYAQYAKHYVVAFIYTRNERASEGEKHHISELQTLQVPYKDVEVFVQEKYKISGEKPGSGNTENIGSYKTDKMDYLINGEGPFSVLGLEIFEEYWAGYPKYRAEKKNYTSLEEYFAWCERNGRDMTEAKKMYVYWKELHRTMK